MLATSSSFYGSASAREGSPSPYMTTNFVAYGMPTPKGAVSKRSLQKATSEPKLPTLPKRNPFFEDPSGCASPATPWVTTAMASWTNRTGGIACPPTAKGKNAPKDRMYERSVEDMCSISSTGLIQTVLRHRNVIAQRLVAKEARAEKQRAKEEKAAEKAAEKEKARERRRKRPPVLKEELAMM